MRLPGTIAFNLVYIDPGNTGGMESYAREVLPEIAGLLPNHRLVACLSREGHEHYRDAGLGVELVRLPVNSGSRPKRAVYEQTSLMRAIRSRLGGRDGVPLLHSMGNTGPLRTGSTTHLVTIHDMIPARFPAAVGARWMQPALVALTCRVARAADRVITDSASSARDIEQLAQVAAADIDVVPLAGGHAAPVPDQPFDVRERFQLGDGPYVLGASATLAHKNVAALIRAFARVNARPAPQLVLPGYPVPDDHELRMLTDRLGLADRVHFLGWVDAADLDALYRQAECFVFPSLYEGFGLPVLEAMHRGTPVACADTSSLPEVGGDAVIYFDPADEAAIAACIDDLLADAALRTRLSNAGRERASQFTWHKTAERTIESYERAVRAARG